jgi:hypothetical protein
LNRLPAGERFFAFLFIGGRTRCQAAGTPRAGLRFLVFSFVVWRDVELLPYARREGHAQAVRTFFVDAEPVTCRRDDHLFAAEVATQWHPFSHFSFYPRVAGRRARIRTSTAISERQGDQTHGERRENALIAPLFVFLDRVLVNDGDTPRCVSGPAFKVS